MSRSPRDRGDMQPEDANSAADFATLCVHSPHVDAAEGTPPVSPPLFHASAFETPSLDLVTRALDGEPGLYSYGRTANPTVAAFETAVAQLEGAEAACAAASGMGAIASLLLGVAHPGDTVVVASDLYGTTARLLENLSTFGYRVVPLTGGRMPADTRLVFAEVITNPLLAVTDLEEVARAARACGALLAVDSTFATPYHCRALELGADLVVHSATKYLGGHGDLLAGVVAGRADLVTAARGAMQRFGAPLAPSAAWLALRGLRTLALRMERQSANAALVAAHLSEHPAVARVFYPGLSTHPTHATATRTLRRGYGAMVAFNLATENEAARTTTTGAGDTRAVQAADGAAARREVEAADGAVARRAVEDFLGALQTIRFVASLGDVATTVSHPATTSHRGISGAARLAQGIADSTLRLSVGAEASDDIIADLNRGLNEVLNRAHL